MDTNTHHRFLVFIITCLGFTFQLMAQSGMAVYQTDVYLGKGSDVAVFGDILLDNEKPIQNEGVLAINASARELILTNYAANEAIKGTGAFRLNALNTINLAGNNWQVSNMQKAGNQSVQLQTGLHIYNTLELQEGKIIGNGFITSIAEGTGSISFNHVEENTAYVVGDLRIPINYGDSTVFPVGDETHYHPITLSNYLKDNSWVQLNYQPANIYANNPGVYFIAENWWNFTLENSDATGYVNASVSAFNFGLSNLDGNMYIAPIHASKEGLTDDLPYFFDEELQQSNKDNSSYTLTAIENPGHINIADITSLRIIMPNYLKRGDNFNNNFIIPNIDIIGNAEVVIFSRLGNIIYESNNYQNDFDFTDYPQGTYYYSINFEIKGELHTYQSFIEII